MAKKGTNKQNKSNKTNDYITLVDDLGNEVKFALLDVIDYNDEEYVFLFPEYGGDIMILKIDYTVDGEENYIGIDDEKLVETLFLMFKEKNKDIFN